MSAHFVGSRPFANLLQVSVSDVPPSFNVVGCCPGPTHRILAALVRPVTWGKQWCCMSAMVMSSSAHIIDVGDCMDNQLD